MAKAQSIDTRTLHVATQYKSYEDTSLALLLSQSTDKLVNKFKAIANGQAGVGAGSNAEAETLQDFFNKIKELDGQKASDDDDLTTAAIKTVIHNATKNLGEKRRKLFPAGLTGAEFEQVLSAIVVETVGSAAATPFSNGAELAKAANLGSQSFRAGGIKEGVDLLELPSAIAQSIAEAHGDQLRYAIRKSIKKNNNGIATVQLKEVHQANAKVDVTGIILCDVEINANHQLAHVAELLKTASFSAKNYSLAYAKAQVAAEARKEMKLENINLRLGASKLDTVFMSLFGDIYPSPVVISMLFYALNTSDPSIKMKLNQLRFIYELTGYGQHYYKGSTNIEIENKFKTVVSRVFKDIGFDSDPFRVNYFIWNNPDAGGGIYVRSAAGLIAELYETFTDEMVETVELSAKYMGIGT